MTAGTKGGWNFSVNGKEITLRPIKPEDEPLHKDMFMSLSEETIRFRFLKVIKELSHAELVRFCYIDYDREITLVAIANENGKKNMVGICMLTGDPDNEAAEFAIMLRDEWQNDGSLKAILEIPAGLQTELFDKLNSLTHGEIESKIIKIK